MPGGIKIVDHFDSYDIRVCPFLGLIALGPVPVRVDCEEEDEDSRVDEHADVLRDVEGGVAVQGDHGDASAAQQGQAALKDDDSGGVPGP